MPSHSTHSFRFPFSIPATAKFFSRIEKISLKRSHYSVNTTQKRIHITASPAGKTPDAHPFNHFHRTRALFTKYFKVFETSMIFNVDPEGTLQRNFPRTRPNENSTWFQKLYARESAKVPQNRFSNFQQCTYLLYNFQHLTNENIY